MSSILLCYLCEACVASSFNRVTNSRLCSSGVWAYYNSTVVRRLVALVFDFAFNWLGEVDDIVLLILETQNVATE